MISSLIKNYLIFFNQALYTQVLMELKLKIVFHKFEYNKSENGFISSNAQLGISKSNIINCICRVIFGLFQLLNEYSCWLLHKTLWL